MNMKLVAGNWKMNGTRAGSVTLLHALKKAGAGHKGVEVVVCPPFTLLDLAMSELKGSGIHLGAQDCSLKEEGAYTGDISPAMLKDAGCSYVITGHSERREYHQESDKLVRDKMTTAHKAGLKTILCVGEKDPKMDEAMRKDVVRIQLTNSLPGSATAENTVIAYEPVWAIGSGLTPTLEQITAMHEAIRGFLPSAVKAARIIYGGSVKPDNAKAILSLKAVDGALPGGASLKAESFLPIIEAAA
jgi:triosephosphate isomerase (TIM)